MSGDGRLDLDELGDVIDHASTLDTPARTEVIDDGRGRSVGERLEDAGVTPWLRRHRVAIASVTAVAVLAATGVVAYRALVPPPLDPEIRVTVTPVIPSQFVLGDTVQGFDQVGIFFTASTLRSAYALSTTDPAESSTYSIVGLTGPGVRASGTSPLPTSDGRVPGQVARQDVDVVTDCFDAGFLGSRASDYSLVVSRTDDRGRTTTRPVAMPAGAPDWSAFVTSVCLQTQAQFGLVPQAVSVSVDRRTHVVSTGIVVSNAMAVPTTVTMSPSYGITQVVPRMPTTQLPALRGAVLPIDLEVRDCANPTLPFIGLPSFPGSQSYDSGGAAGFYLAVAFPPDVVDPTLDPTGSRGTGQAPMTFPASQQRVIDGALQSLCAGAPRAAAEVREVGVARRVLGVFPSGNAQSTRFPITLAVTVPGAERVRLTSSQPLPDESPTTRVAPAAATVVVDGRATLQTWVDVDCQTGYAPPPLAQLEVTTSRGAFPLQVPVDDANLTQAIAANCPELPLQQLLDFGWAAPA